ncbi:hypothetical protein [Acidithiobacillus sp.]|jgi:GT2 family glycosyltransferase|uniref:hypothetical protein n=1 Tax=Acidithiobacillus sp. TaxID=1872118 RepID=UPI00356363EC
MEITATQQSKAIQLQKRTLVIVLNWNKPKQTRVCLDSITRLNGCYDVLVIDNGSNDDKREDLIKIISDDYKATIINNDADGSTFPVDCAAGTKVYIMLINYNSGYAIGNNYGLRFSRRARYEFSLISNNDIEITDINVLTDLERTLDLDNKYAWTAPKIVGVNGKPEGPFAKTNISELFFKKGILFPYWLAFLRKHEVRVNNNMSTKFNNNELEPYIFGGSFGLFRNSALDDVGYFDEHTFLYTEEQILSERLHNKGYLLKYTPNTEILHKHDYRNDGLNFRLELTFLRSRIYYYHKYRGYGKLTLLAGAASRIFWLVFFKPAIVCAKKIIQ